MSSPWSGSVISVGILANQAGMILDYAHRMLNRVAKTSARL